MAMVVAILIFKWQWRGLWCNRNYDTGVDGGGCCGNASNNNDDDGGYCGNVCSNGDDGGGGGECGGDSKRQAGMLCLLVDQERQLSRESGNLL